MKILIVYATHTGSTLYAAKELVGALSDEHEVKLLTANETQIEDLTEAEVVLVGSSSWDWEGNRGYPIHEMMEWLGRVKDFDFSQKKVAIFGCGDRDFEHFCGALNVIWEKLAATGAKELLNPLRLNRYFMDEMGNQEKVREWAGKVAEKLKS